MILVPVGIASGHEETARYYRYCGKPKGIPVSILLFTSERSHAPARGSLSPATVRGLYTGFVVAAAIVGGLATGSGAAQAAVAAAGADLTRLLRFMALIKAALAMAAVAAVVWRLGWPVSAVRFGGYALAGAGMVAGPGLIWGMAHVGLGALSLHVGLAATIVLLWRDPAVARALEDALRRRAARR